MQTTNFTILINHQIIVLLNNYYNSISSLYFALIKKIMMENEIKTNETQVNTEQAHYITKVYGWMALVTVISGLVAFFTNHNPAIAKMIISNSYTFWVLIGLQVGIIIFLTALINKMSANIAVVSFVLYSIVTGFVFSSLYTVITLGGDIASTFFIISAMFGLMAAIGHFTKTDLKSTGRIILMGLVGCVIATSVNYFMDSDALYWITSFAGVVIFIGLVVIDSKKLKEINKIGNEGSDDDEKEAIMGAVCLYIVF